MIDQEQEINDLKKENLMLKKILDTIDANIYWKNSQGKYLGMNNSNAAALKLSCAQDAIGKTELELLKDQSLAQSILDNDLEVIKNNTTTTYEENYPIHDDQIGVYLAKKRTLFDDQKNKIGLVGISVNITDRKELEKEIKYKNKELEKKDAIKTQFIENFSHDVKVPINALIGRIQLLKLIGQKEKNEKFIKVATDTENSAMVLDTLFKQMQNIITHEQFDNNIYSTTFNLFSLVDEEIKIAEASIQSNKKINIHLSISENLSIDVYTDHYKLSQIIRNLLSNAIKYTDEGNIDIQTEIIEGNSKQVIFNFKVSDTGIGIHKAHQDNIFELFNRAGITSHNNNRHGLGIGLYIVKNNVSILGGSISFESYLGQGSKFFISIPLEAV
ncbi:PAS domain-containing sensor histidine kinase [Francisella uliginis]|uniref:histidine kinase n=1 Tax=Francisella uliginis TaxID=573570 RepID=A0A1L4BSM9_9GAMM|nr:ATP-binding protein [Francisella uliginis]API86834.1 hypothetical protein F7310_05465 [Francisella uliginis]